MKRLVALLMVLCLLLAGCAGSQAENVETPVAGKTIVPLPDTTMENLDDAIFAISLEKGDAYVDEEGILQIDVTIYTYDMYDMVDVAMLEVGDTIVRYSGEVEVTSKEQTETGLIVINGGLEEGGFDLTTNDGGIYYEIGFDDAKNWYEVGTATLRVSTEFEGFDNADPDAGEVIFYPGDLLNDAIENFYFTPHNTTIRTEGGQVVEMNRRYVP